MHLHHPAAPDGQSSGVNSFPPANRGSYKIVLLPPHGSAGFEVEAAEKSRFEQGKFQAWLKKKRDRQRICLPVLRL